MLQFVFVLFACLVGGILAGYPDHSSGNDIGTANNNGNSYGYGYSGSFSGPGAAPENFQFPQELSNLFKTLNKYQEDIFKNGGGSHSYAYVSTNPNGKSRAEAISSISFKRNKGFQAQAASVQNNLQSRGSFADAGDSSYGGGYGGSFSTGNGNGQSFGGSFSSGFPGAGGGPGYQFIPGPSVTGSFTPDANGASAFGVIGPGGIQQGASVFPENANAPNVNVRFSSDQPDGFKSVYTSSSSYTTNVDGKPKTVQKSSTTVNDNGKVTTYEAHNP
ncbi:keratin, type I cytoskeletal 9 isoform X1 [Diabrotica virgifera virgifera]|uniref:Keratin, type I cytoskeletal 9-like isoform X1 n=1 Tax=Diabrotica virgifera virgifera TaxID=50390 RepID=A0A6P7G424_DIAVI|nr:keratin, type I cytoskeletal 9 isoform X1 [Diabrotica virgifera virgifera]